jgi:hypothetical protein
MQDVYTCREGRLEWSHSVLFETLLTMTIVTVLPGRGGARLPGCSIQNVRDCKFLLLTVFYWLWAAVYHLAGA